jgi:hypothetical protein
MIWHIFKKDARLLWWLAAGIAGLRFAEVAMVHSIGLFPASRQLMNLMMYLAAGVLLGVVFATCAVVHQDAIPGVRQDWLVRPIRRRDLLLAKFLFVVVLIQGPIFIADLVQGLAAGFPAGASLAAASSRSMFLLFLVNIPLLAFASVTRNLLEAITGGVLLFLLFAIFEGLFGGDPAHRFQPTLGTGMEWITVSAMALILCIAAAILLRLQFFRRRTFPARCFGIAFAILTLIATFLPWQPAFAIQKSLARAMDSAAAVGLSFQPELGRLRRDASFPLLYPLNGTFALIYLPMRLSGLPENSGVQSDRVQIRVIDPDGALISALPSFSISGLQTGARRSHGGSPDQDAYQNVPIRGDLYARIKDRPVRLEINYSLTLFTLASSHALPAINGNQRIPGVGWCTTGINPPETAVRLACEQAGRGPDCMTLILEHIPTGQRNPERFGCDADYAPYRDWQIIPDGMARFGGNLPFRDPNGLAKYPVNGSKLAESRVLMQIYRAADHFTRKLVIPEIRLSDWEAVPAD